MQESDLVTSKWNGGFIWFRLPRDITIDNYRTIEDYVMGKVSGTEDRVVLDLADTAHVYSSGIGMLVRVRTAVAGGGGTLCLVNVDRKISDMLRSMHLDKILPMYSTDVEFEISEEEVWKEKMAEDSVNFSFGRVAHEGVCKIRMIGHMNALHDLSKLNDFLPGEGVHTCVLDLSGVELVDTYGGQMLMDLARKCRDQGMRVGAFGANEYVMELLGYLAVDNVMYLYETEDALLEDMLNL